MIACPKTYQLLEEGFVLELLTLHPNESARQRGAQALHSVPPDWLSDPDIRRICDTLRGMKPADWNAGSLVATVRASDKSTGRKDDAAIVSLLLAIIDQQAYPPGGNGSRLSYTVQHLRDAFYSRERERLTAEASLAAKRGDSVAPYAVQLAACEAADAMTSLEPYTMLDSCEAYLSDVSKGVEEEAFVSSSISLYDVRNKGFVPGNLVVVGAPTGGGKSQYAVQLAMSFAERKQHVLMFSLEMSCAELAPRFLASGSKETFSTISQREKSRQLRHELWEVAKRSSFVTVQTPRSLTLTDIRAALQIADTKPHLLIVDYMQLMKYEGSSHDSRQEQVASFSRGLKAIAREHRLVILAPVQLNDDGRVRESRAIEHDADVFFTLTPNKEHDEAEIRVLKCRAGSRGNFTVPWHPDRCTIGAINHKAPF